MAYEGREEDEGDYGMEEEGGEGTHTLCTHTLL